MNLVFQFVEKNCQLFFLFSPERPIKFTQELKNIQVQEGNEVTLCCDLSKPDYPVNWLKGDKALNCGDKYQMKQNGATLELVIKKSQPEDSGKYSCVCEGARTTATIIITGQTSLDTIHKTERLILFTPCDE